MKVNRPLVAAVYLVLAMLILTPLVETTLAVLPLRPSALNWRFGAAGLYSRAVIVPLFGLLLVTGVAAWLGQRLVVRVVGVMVGLGALIAVVASVLFVLDALQMRAQVPAEARGGFDRSTAIALLTMWVVAVTGVLLSIGSWKMSRGEPGRSGAVETPQLIRS